MLVNSLHHLCVNPKVVEILREEIEETVNEFGWTKTAIDNMQKLDSFLKETSRFSGSNAGKDVEFISCTSLSDLVCLAGVNRRAMKDFVFSNGIVLPEGTMISCPAYSLHHDEVCDVETKSSMEM
jgi:hypothetical protein